MAEAVAVASQSTIITISSDGTTAKVEGVNSYGVRQVWTMPPQRVGELLANLQGPGRRLKWLDLLGATTPGVAMASTSEHNFMILSFPRRPMVMRRMGSLDRREELNVSLPPSLWVARFDTRAETLSGAWLIVSQTMIRSITDTTTVHAFPMGNVYDSSANICWGNVQTRHLRPADPLALDNLFFSTDFNTDLAHPVFMAGRPAGAAESVPLFRWADYNGWLTWQRANPGGELHLSRSGGQSFTAWLAGVIGGADED